MSFSHRYRLLKIGADVEVFVKSQQNNRIVPVVGYIGGTKEKPIKIFPNDEFSAIQEDNVMAEFNIMPADMRKEFVENIKNVINQLQKVCHDKGLLINIKPSHKFTKKQLASEQAQQIGCSPDYNAWTLQMNNSLNPEVLGNLRTCGGHVHISYNVNKLPGEDDKIHQAKAVRFLDLFLGVPSILVDKDDERRKYYGKAGAYRPKDYGVEYRVLSNFWIKNESYMKTVYYNIHEAFNFLNSANNNLLDDETSKQIIQCINTSDRALAKKLIKKWEVSAFT